MKFDKQLIELFTFNQQPFIQTNANLPEKFV